MAKPRKPRASGASRPTPSPAANPERVVIVVGPDSHCAETVARNFATQGETMRVMWFAQACQALAAGVQKLAGVIVCHRAGQAPDGELGLLRSAWPETPVLPWQLG